MVQVFLVGIIETAKNSIATFDNILKLQKQVDSKIQSLGSRTANAQKVLHYLYQRPMIDAARVGEAAGISPASAYKLIADLEQFRDTGRNHRRQAGQDVCVCCLLAVVQIISNNRGVIHIMQTPAVGQIERKTQNRVVKLFNNVLKYTYLGNWEDRPNNSNIEEDIVRKYLSQKGIQRNTDQ